MIHVMTNFYLKVLQTMTMIMAPILPYLSEEVYHHTKLQSGSTASEIKSVFAEGWRSVVRDFKLFIKYCIECTRTIRGTMRRYQKT